MKTIRSLMNIFWEAGIKFGVHDCASRASSLAYYGLFSLFPLLLLLVYIGGQSLNSEEVFEALNTYTSLLFPESIEYLRNIIDQTMDARGPIGMVGALSLIWSASSVFGVLEGSLSIIWEGTSSAFWRKRLLAAISIILLGLVFLASFPLRPLIDWIWLDDGVAVKDALGVVAQILLGSLIIFLLFRIFPNRNIPWRPALTGALFVTLAVEFSRSLVSGYLAQTFIKFGYIYGSLAWFLTLAFWVYLVGIILFYGAELGMEIERKMRVK